MGDPDKLMDYSRMQVYLAIKPGKKHETDHKTTKQW